LNQLQSIILPNHEDASLFHENFIIKNLGENLVSWWFIACEAGVLKFLLTLKLYDIKSNYQKNK
jgi:hypothetical protein